MISIDFYGHFNYNIHVNESGEIAMKWTKMELVNQINVTFEEKLIFDLNDFKTLDRLNNLCNVTAKGNGHYDSFHQRFTVDLDIAGEMVVPCAITLEDVTVPFMTIGQGVFSFISTDEVDIHVCKKDFVDLYPTVFQLILAEVPLKVVKKKVVYPKGDGWEVMTEEQYRSQLKSTTDPRLAKLKEFKFEEEN